MDNKNMLDKSQRKAVRCKRNTILVLAGAGCGKTYTIISRIKYLIDELKVDPKDILCISFTNDSVNSLKNKLYIKDIDVLTFHKLALKIIGNKKEVLSEDMLIHIINDTFNNKSLFGLYKMNKDEMFNLVYCFINLFKCNNYKLDDFYKFINKANYVEKTLLKEIMKCYICYESYLNKENIIDFNDMISLAIDKLDNCKLRYKHIIIDEYQDTSITKLELIKKLKRLSNATLFAVGDDFQSIYRFAGSNVKLIIQFRKYFKFSKIIKLKYTYRNSKQLINLAGKFIMKNPYQIRKKLKSDITVNNPVIIVYYKELLSSINNIIMEDNIDDLFILSRNNKDLDNINIKNINYTKMSIHKSKGLESKYVFVINVNDSSNGFPNKYMANPILRFVNDYKQYYPYDEERRLFYVALTRCTYRVYLFVPYNNPSIFIKELEQNKNIIIKK